MCVCVCVCVCVCACVCVWLTLLAQHGKQEHVQNTMDKPAELPCPPGNFAGPAELGPTVLAQQNQRMQNFMDKPAE